MSAESIDSANVAEIPISTFDCQLCLSLLCEPVTTACGHTFCKTCLLASLDRSSKRCPVCRAPCHVSARGRVSNVLLTSILKQHFPIQYAKRIAEVQEMENSLKCRVPLFCFNEVLFPNQPFHLHFFEPRYRLMVQRALETNRQFGFCSSYEPKSGQYGTIAEIRECEFLADGRSLVVCEGKSRFKILDSWVEDSTQGLWYAQVDFFDDVRVVEEEESKQMFDAAIVAESKLHSYLSNLSAEKRAQVELALGQVPAKEHPYKLSMWISSMLPASPQCKTVLLSTTSTSKRLKLVLMHAYVVR